METNNVELANASIAYVDKGKGKTIVLLHGFCGSSKYWEEVIPALAEQYRVIAPDLPGHGESSTIREHFSITDMADIMKELLDVLKIDKATMFGHSLGGYITLAFAQKYPDMLDGFSLVHSTAFPDSDEAKQGRSANIEKIKKDGIKPFIEGLVPKLFSPAHLEKDYVKTAIEIGYLTPPEGAMGTLAAMRDRPDTNSVIENSTLPVLLIAGENDQIIPPEKTFSVSKTNIKHALVKDAGHMSLVENVPELISVMKKYLGQK